MTGGFRDGQRQLLTSIYTQTFDSRHFHSGDLCCLLISSNIVIFQCVTLGRASNCGGEKRELHA